MVYTTEEIINLFFGNNQYAYRTEPNFSTDATQLETLKENVFELVAKFREIVSVVNKNKEKKS